MCKEQKCRWCYNFGQEAFLFSWANSTHTEWTLRSKTYKDYLQGSPTNIALCSYIWYIPLSEFYKISSRSKQLTALEALELNCDYRGRDLSEENTSEVESYLEVNSESDDFDYEPNEETAIHIPQSKTIASKMVKYSGLHSQIYIRQKYLHERQGQGPLEWQRLGKDRYQVSFWAGRVQLHIENHCWND